MLAAHVVGRGQHVPERRPAQHEALNSAPSAPVTVNVRFEWPPAMTSNANGPTAPATWRSNQAVTDATSTPGTSAGEIAASVLIPGTVPADRSRAAPRRSEG